MFSAATGYTLAQASGKPNKHGSSSHGSRRGTTDGHSRGTKTKSQKQAGQGTSRNSFLFVVNEFQVNYEPLQGQGHTLTDQWLNTMPPQQAEAYVGESPGTVFRYEDGVVSPAPGYCWYRPAMGQEGRIARLNQAANEFDGWPAVYRAQTVFACSALLPMIVAHGDASLPGSTFMRRNCPCDHDYDVPGCSPWSYLHFTPGHVGGVSYVNADSSGNPWAVGQQASWIPSLVPSAYKNTTPSAPHSSGLSGHLAIIIALMGFHGRPRHASNVFLEQRWHRGQWLGSSRASSYLPKLGETPRGLFVQICVDNLEDGQPDDEEFNLPVSFWSETLMPGLEYRTILVHG
ncbi:hypothetical protein N658DRAFT_478672 [Parathielavia hyrcaniae]|uniref:Uncharacterized protein n=1 Tax=Parathielavia hyrcaniae TaxID=113614 RepID=A0AAN6PTN6_9PEZI|nr:hypothetical protein N658DRAFT_478672 [Parathielavia hyrcaniae]